MAEALKEVLVIFGNRRRPVSFPSSEDGVVMKRVEEKFLDILLPGKKFYLQIASEKWGDKLIDLNGPIPDGGVIHLFQEESVVTEVQVIVF